MDDVKFKEPPHSIRCEQEILGGIMYNPKIISDVVTRVNEEDFYVTSHKKIYKALKELFEEGSEITLTMIIEKLGKEELKISGGVTYLTELMTGAVAVNLTHYINILKDKAHRRKAISEFNKASAKLYDNKIKFSETIEEVTNNLLDCDSDNTPVLKDGDLLKRTLEDIEKRVKRGGSIPGMKTGFRDFDRSVGGLQKGELCIVAGRPSMGKTLFALNLADGLADNELNILICELEMTEKSLVMRRLSYKSQVEAEKMKFGILSAEEINKILESADLLSRNNKVFTDCTPDAGLLSIKSKAKTIKKSHGLDVIVIDHLNLMNIPHKETRDMAIGEVTRGLKILAKELDVCVVLICQLSRAVELRNDKRPMLSDIRESGNIEQDADIVMIIYRDEYYNKYTKEPGIMECIIGKHRNGRIGTIKFKYDDRYQKISDISN